MAILSTSASFPLPSVLTEPADALDEDNFATEILPAPPSLASVSLSARDHVKRPPPVLSYLPTSDPGSTYTGGPGSLSGTTSVAGDDARRRKRARLDKGPNGRAQRASTRNASLSSQPSVAPINPQPLNSKIIDTETTLDSSYQPISPRGSSPEATDEVPPHQSETSQAQSSLHSLRSFKVKDRERAGEGVKREPLEPVSSTSLGIDAMQPPLANHDHCSACRSNGSLLYCDSCPMAFHLWCLNPPLDHSEVPGQDSAWHCPSCTQRQHPRPHPSPSIFSSLIYAAETSLPVEYSLPEDIRGYFKNVSTGPRGGYKDSSTVRAPRVNRLGFAEDRDPYRLKDRNGETVVCFRCGKSSIPEESSRVDLALEPEQPTSGRPKRAAARNISYRLSSVDIELRSMLSCDYCSLSWHLDCLSPPLTSMPPMTRKWMCPNHAQNTVKNHRIPKNGLSPIEVRQTRVANNGNIEIVPSDERRARNTVSVDEVLINGRIYRVPERIVILDFWDKLQTKPNQWPWRDVQPLEKEDSSSPLTSLSSLDESFAEPSMQGSVEPSADSASIAVARILCDLASSNSLRDSSLRSNTVDETVSESSAYLQPSASRGFEGMLPAQNDHVSGLSQEQPLPSSSSELSSLHSSDLDEPATLNGASSFKIRIPRPLNIAVAAASAAKSKIPEPRRSLRRTTSNYRSRSPPRNEGTTGSGKDMME